MIKRMELRISQELHDKVKKLADDDDRSVNTMLVRLIENGVEVEKEWWAAKEAGIKMPHPPNAQKLFEGKQ